MQLRGQENIFLRDNTASDGDIWSGGGKRVLEVGNGACAGKAAIAAGH